LLVVTGHASAEPDEEDEPARRMEAQSPGV